MLAALFLASGAASDKENPDHGTCEGRDHLLQRHRYRPRPSASRCRGCGKGVHRCHRRPVVPAGLADKVYSAFTSSSTAHCGQESTLLALENTFYR